MILRTMIAAVVAILLVWGVPADGAHVREPKPKKEPKPAKQPKEVKPKQEPLGESLCPATIGVEQRITAPPEGWEASQSVAKPQLAFVTFFDGPPAERASLKYDREEKQKRDWVAIWTLARQHPRLLGPVRLRQHHRGALAPATGGGHELQGHLRAQDAGDVGFADGKARGMLKLGGKKGGREEVKQ